MISTISTTHLWILDSELQLTGLCPVKCKMSVHNSNKTIKLLLVGFQCKKPYL